MNLPLLLPFLQHFRIYSPKLQQICLIVRNKMEIHYLCLNNIISIMKQEANSVGQRNLSDKCNVLDIRPNFVRLKHNMTYSLLLLFAFFWSVPDARCQDFLAEQRKYPRVRQAMTKKGETISNILSAHDIKTDKLHIAILAFKAENRLDVFAKSAQHEKFRKVASYKICADSGTLGPKRKQGDRQVPEGFYYIDRFNPSSNYYLSLGINYPNGSDKIKSGHVNPGGEIFIHGACVTIGCLPMTDDKMKEIYLYAVYARNSGQTRIPVYIFPFEMTGENMKTYSKQYAGENELLSFWKNLKQGYELFNDNREGLNFRISGNGDYQF